jgi:hypothetical protein
VTAPRVDRGMTPAAQHPQIGRRIAVRAAVPVVYLKVLGSIAILALTPRTDYRGGAYLSPSSRTPEVYETDRDGSERKLTPDSELPLHGQVFSVAWNSIAQYRRVRFDCGWADQDSIPEDVVQAVFALAQATWDRRPALADPAREHLRSRYKFDAGGWGVTGL